jgi:hypothetical protein
MGLDTNTAFKGSREVSVNKRQKKKLFKKRSAFYPNGGPDVFLFQVFTGVGMTKKKWERLDKMLEDLFEDMEYDQNTRNVENFNRIMAERRK